MSAGSEMQFLHNLKIILRCNLVWIITTVIVVCYLLIFTVFIRYSSDYSGDETVIIGTILKYSFNGNKLQMNIAAEEEIIATYYMESEEEKEYLLKNIGIGKNIELYGTLTMPLNNTVPNNFNYKKYLYQQKIFYLLDIDSYEIKGDNSLFEKIKDFFIKRAYSLENSDYLLALVMGDKSLFNSDEYNNYQINGTSHLLAISGSHVSVLLYLFGVLLKKVKDLPKLIILSVILLFFGYLTNFQAAVCRAIIFFIINRVNTIWKFNLSHLQVLFITAVVLIIINPFIIYDLGFIYSFVVCTGMFFYSNKITGNYVTKLFKLSVIAFLFSFPISAYINYEVNVVSPLINMLFVPWISLIIFPLSIATFFLPFLNSIYQVGINITEFMNQAFTNISLFINIPKMSLIIVIVLLGVLLLAKNNKKYYIGIIIILALVKLSPYLNNSYQVYYLDVGQGDSTVIILPHKSKVLMIDTGGKVNYVYDEWKISSKSYNLSDNTIKFLKSKGVTSIDYLLISHGDYDHMGESINLVNNFNVENVIFNNDSYNDLENSLIEVLDEKKIPYYNNIKTLNLKYSTLYFLNDKLYDNENDNSSVIYMELDEIKLLFMGDAGIDVEQDIINTYELPNITFLKVGHHGSKTSTSSYFLENINVSISVISVGRNNRYNHPNSEVLANLENTDIYRTDLMGTIQVIIRGNDFSIKTYEPYS